MWLLLYAIFCIAFAWLNAKLIIKGRRIYHGLNGSLHLIICGLFYYHFGIATAITGLLLARVCFDWSLNLFMGLPIDYVPKKPKSIVDKIEKVVFLENGILPKIIYIFFIIMLNG